MKIFVNILIVTLVYIIAGRVISPPTPKVSLYNSYEIKYADKFAEYTLSGNVPGIGSGLTLLSEESDTKKEFLSIADNGSFLTTDKGKRTPFVGRIVLADEVATLASVIPLNGLAKNFDGEDIDIENEAVVWLADEAEPSIVRYQLALQRPLSVYTPGHGLPKILQHKMDNRGIEALAVLPGGKVIFALQSVLDIEGKTSKLAKHIRVLQFDPKTQEVRTFVYPIDTDLYSALSEVKIGGFTAINSHKVLLIEQGPGKDGNYINRINEIDFNIVETIEDDKGEIERKGEVGGLFGKGELKPQEIINLRNYGWRHNKAEGIALTEKGRTIYITNDIDNKVDLNINYEQDPLKVYLWEFRLDNSFKISLLVDIAYRIAPGIITLIAMAFLLRKRKS
ncbi:MAG: esterase-like activity of phytase family protein [Bdellovibrionales bacterium]|nr:esterase-like activity of phytase family protein [Bdellovibrionales bacterium]